MLLLNVGSIYSNFTLSEISSHSIAHLIISIEVLSGVRVS